MKWFKRLTQGLSKTTQKATGLLVGRKIDTANLSALEDELIMSDLGYELATDFTEKLRKTRFNQEISSGELRSLLSKEISDILQPVAQPLTINTQKHKPFIILMVGVNGSGKTTTIAKLGKLWQANGYSQLWVAGDTFRAAAVEQLQIWANRLNIPLLTGKEKSDAAALAFEAIEKAKKENTDLVVIDTAGRLQNKAHLMDELSKIDRVIKKQNPDAPHATILVLDANVGQNAFSQVELFQQAAKITGLIVTKLDGTAKGGVVVAIANKYKLPIYAIGVGEAMEDLQPFDAQEFADAMLNINEN